MLVLSKRIFDMPIVSLQTGGVLAQIESAIIDPRHLHVVAFYCFGPGLDSTPAVLHTDDIREVGSMGLLVDSTENIMAPDDLVRLQEVLSYKFKLEDKPVIDDTGKKLGKVTDYAVETDTFYVIKIHVQPSLLRGFATAEHIVDRSQIIEINERHIVVKAPTIKVHKPETARRAMVENPFRHASPQPDAHSHS